MTAASDNKFPKVIITEGSAPSSPSAGDQKLYIDSSSHHLSRKNSGGTVVDLETNQSSASTVTAHGARVIRASTTFNVGNNTLTAVAFDGTDVLDTDSIHDPASNNTRLTIPSISGVTTGLWTIKASGYTATSLAVDAYLKVNGTTGIAFDRFAAATSLTGFLVATEYVFSAADYVELYVRTPTGNGDIAYDVGVSPIFTIAFLGKVT